MTTLQPSSTMRSGHFGRFGANAITTQEQVILVDELDNPLGVAEKQQAHVRGQLHRAFSIFVFNSAGELLLQQRAPGKYHSAGLWSNSCCGHPRPDETTRQAAHRRLTEEMGFSCPLSKAFDFIYKAEFSNNLTEHEFDHVFVGQFDGEPVINAEEATAYRWQDLNKLSDDIQRNNNHYSYWLNHIIATQWAQLQQAMHSTT